MYPWQVVITPLTIPKASSRTFTTGASEFVVQEALETQTVSAERTSSFTPSTTVASGSSLHGAEMTTFLAPASRWLS